MEKIIMFVLVLICFVGVCFIDIAKNSWVPFYIALISEMILGFILYKKNYFKN